MLGKFIFELVYPLVLLHHPKSLLKSLSIDLQLDFVGLLLYKLNVIRCDGINTNTW